MRSQFQLLRSEITPAVVVEFLSASLSSSKVISVPTQTTNSKNSNLNAAKAARMDEFYTQWADIEREMNAYLEYDQDVFRDKVILLPCDDPEWSNFTKFFALHFLDFGLKKLISTSYAPDSNPAKLNYQPSLFEAEDPRFDETKTHTNGKLFVLERKDVTGDGVVNIDDLQWEYLVGTGDFNSLEVLALRDEADVIITNPPFSLIKDFIAWLIKSGKRFSIIGPRGATLYKEIFPLIRGNQMWLGRGFQAGNAYFAVPDNKGSYAGGVYDDETGLVKFRNCCWFTNIDHGRRHEPLQLMTEADNIKFSKHKEVRGVGYQRYENYDAIEVPFVDAIPSDFDGLMGVPVTFLEKHDPDQFEIVGTLESSDPENPGRTRWYTSQDQKDAYFKRFGKPGSIPLNMSGVIDGVKVYKRVLIRRKSAT